MATISYPFDTTGLSNANLVIDEPHVISELNATTYRIFVPKFAPFYVNNFVLNHISITNVKTTLVEGRDYYFCLPFIGGARSTGKMLYGAISLNHKLIDGMFELTYQTIGGDWITNPAQVLLEIAEKNYNPRIVPWDKVINKPEIFPTTEHKHDANFIYGQKELKDAIKGIEDALTGVGSTFPADLSRHTTDYNNPHHVTASTIGLPDVANLPIADDQEVMALADVNKYMTLRQLSLFMNQYKRRPIPAWKSLLITTTNTVKSGEYKPPIKLALEAPKLTDETNPVVIGNVWEVSTDPNFTATVIGATMDRENAISNTGPSLVSLSMIMDDGVPYYIRSKYISTEAGDSPWYNFTMMSKFVNTPPTGDVIIDHVTPVTLGTVLTATNNISDVDGVGIITYKWIRNGSLENVIAEGDTYTVAEADNMSEISCVAYYMDNRNTVESVVSSIPVVVPDLSSAINKPPVSTLTIGYSAPLYIGSEVWPTGAITDPDGMGAITYTWFRNGSAQIATGNKYTLTADDSNVILTVVATYLDNKGKVESVTSAGVGIAQLVAKPLPNTPTTGTVTINYTGQLQDGTVLTAANTLTDQLYLV
jgi:hypothetical protein